VGKKQVAVLLDSKIVLVLDFPSAGVAMGRFNLMTFSCSRTVISQQSSEIENDDENENDLRAGKHRYPFSLPLTLTTDTDNSASPR
jgi:hypothetical protein